MNKKKQTKIVKQGPWVIVSYKDINNKGEEDEFDAGYLEFIHNESGRRFLKEMSWMRGEGPYQVEGHRVPTLIDIWNIFEKNTPGTTGFSYNNWHVKRDHGCFVYILADPSKIPPVEIYKNIIGDYVSKQQDFAYFIEMLDNIESSIEEGKPKQILFNLEDARIKRDAV